ncbi:ABC transporter substrate-binding protein [Variovorax sp.]|jgi:peptide/nickel transport system substrate-binding protein|uniref:ABC transporter substrate-binding protein n=1 Tax=Variovorax sp. TaxID=1871043 RepID=UPI001381EBD1|nr:ABC transporter substrate-binding protein [Variovorax sp.]KAF1061244.1 MAG: Glutathione-binding protein GsiB [Variovorax sp.]
MNLPLSPSSVPAGSATDADRRRFIAGIAASVGVVSLGLPAAAQAQTGATPRKGGTLIVGLSGEPSVFDPNRQFSYETYRIDKHIYESLVAEDLSRPFKEGPPDVVPALAESWNISVDATTFTFKLRRGVKFHDGSDFDAEAVRFNVRRFTDPAFEFYDTRSNATMKPVYGGLKEVTVLDSHTVRFVFGHPYIDFLRLLPQGNFVSGIFSPAALRKHGQDGLAEHPTGTGPYRFVARVRNEKTELVRNPDYWGAKPHLDKLIFRPINDDATRLSALRSGQIDILSKIPADGVEGLRKAGFTIHDSPGANQLFLSWYFGNRFAKDKAVRQAFVKAIDREGLVKSLFRGLAFPSYSIFNWGSTAFDPAQKDATYDPEGARRLLANAGYKPGEIEFSIITYTLQQPVIEWIQRDLAKVGVKINIVSLEWLTYASKLNTPTPETALFTMEWGFITPYWLKLAYDTYIVSRGGGEKVVDPQLAPAIARAAAQTAEARAIDEWKKANLIAQRDAAFVPLLSPTVNFIAHKRVKGFNVPLQNFYDLSTVWLDK